MLIGQGALVSVDLVLMGSIRNSNDGHIRNGLVLVVNYATLE